MATEDRSTVLRAFIADLENDRVGVPFHRLSPDLIKNRVVFEGKFAGKSYRIEFSSEEVVDFLGWEYVKGEDQDVLTRIAFHIFDIMPGIEQLQTLIDVLIAERP